MLILTSEFFEESNTYSIQNVDYAFPYLVDSRKTWTSISRGVIDFQIYPANG